jgi:hypothetical protein
MAERRIGAARGGPTSFVGEVHRAIRRAGGNPNEDPGTGKGGGRFNARVRGIATALSLKDRSARSRDGSEEEPMATAKKTARGRKQDLAHVAGRQDYEVRYESKETGRSASAVKKAVKKVGNTRGRFEKHLGP